MGSDNDAQIPPNLNKQNLSQNYNQYSISNSGPIQLNTNNLPIRKDTEKLNPSFFKSFFK